LRQGKGGPSTLIPEQKLNLRRIKNLPPRTGGGKKKNEETKKKKKVGCGGEKEATSKSKKGGLAHGGSVRNHTSGPERKERRIKAVAAGDWTGVEGKTMKLKK